jgi:hypothetical protein
MGNVLRQELTTDDRIWTYGTRPSPSMPKRHLRSLGGFLMQEQPRRSVITKYSCLEEPFALHSVFLLRMSPSSLAETTLFEARIELLPFFQHHGFELDDSVARPVCSYCHHNCNRSKWYCPDSHCFGTRRCSYVASHESVHAIADSSSILS